MPCRSPAVIATLPLISHASEHTHTMMLVTLEGRDKHRESLDYSDPYLAPALEPAALLGCHMIVRNMPQGAHIDSCSSAFLVRPTSSVRKLLLQMICAAQVVRIVMHAP